MISSLELARICGVSQGTVDRALHGRKGISEGTRARVLAAAERHGYQPNPEVVTLLTGKSRIAGAIVPASRSVFMMDLLNQAKTALKAQGLSLYVCAVDDEAELMSTLGDFAARRMRGAIVIPLREHMALPARFDLPIVALLSELRAPRSIFLAPDERRTGRIAVRYLVSRGHHRIVHLTYTRNAPAIRERAEGYAAELETLGGTPMIVRGGDDGAILDAIRRHRATALFCHNDWLAHRAWRCLEQAGLTVPKDVSVLGVDDTPTFSELVPELTSLRYPIDAIAVAAARWICEGRRPPPVPDVQVIERQSVA